MAQTEQGKNDSSNGTPTRPDDHRERADRAELLLLLNAANSAAYASALLAHVAESCEAVNAFCISPGGVRSMADRCEQLASSIMLAGKIKFGDVALELALRTEPPAIVLPGGGV